MADSQSSKNSENGFPDNPSWVKRYTKEWTRISTKSGIEGLRVEKIGGELSPWRFLIPGPKGSPYEGGEFECVVHLPETYPFDPPSVSWVTDIYHMNIDPKDGYVCLDMLKPNGWSPMLTMESLMEAIQQLLLKPDTSAILEQRNDVGKAYLEDRETHDATAREWTKKYALRKE